jgi:predicted transcriptional regulator
VPTTIDLDEGVVERLEELAPGAGYRDAQQIMREAINRRRHELERSAAGERLPQQHSTPAQGASGE